MMRHLSNTHVGCILLLLWAFAASLAAQRTVNMCGDATYVAPESQSLSEAKRTAILRARLQAMADEFGTNVAQTNTMTMHTKDGKTATSFNSYSENEVRGIWLEDTREPEVNISYENSNMVIKAHVCGKAREIKSVPVELLIEPLGYGKHDGQEHPFRPGHVTTEFVNNEFFGVHFKSPVNGYVALFLRDDNIGTVYTQIPYAGSDGYAREVKSNVGYVFLNNKDTDYPYPTSTILTTDRTIEYNTLIVVFSKKPFHVSLAEQGRWFQEQDADKFRKWIHNLRLYESSVQVQEIVLTIRK